MEGPSRTELGLLWRLSKQSLGLLARIGRPFGSVLGVLCMVSEGFPLRPALSEWLTSLTGMGMDDPKPTFSYLARRIKKLYPNFAFFEAVEVERPRDGKESNDFLREIWAPKVFMSNSGYDRQKGMELADRTGGLVSYGKYFLANVGAFFPVTIPLVVSDCEGCSPICRIG